MFVKSYLIIYLQTSVYELARTSDFESLSIIPEDFIKDNGAKFSGKLFIEVFLGAL